MSDAYEGPAWGPEELDRYCAAIEREYARLRPLLSDIPPDDLLLILTSMLRPFGTGKSFFLRRLPDGRYVL